MDDSSDEPEILRVYQLVGQVVAASQLFEVIFVIGAKLALKQADVRALEDVMQVSESKSFKQATKALLNELKMAKLIEPGLESRVARVAEDRHRVIHRSFFEFGWPNPPDQLKTKEFVRLCKRVIADSQALIVEFVELVLAWMMRFPVSSETALSFDQLKFKELAIQIRRQSAAFNAGEH